MADENHKLDGHDRQDVMRGEEGAIGYILAWLLGVPASVLFVIFLLRGCT